MMRLTCSVLLLFCSACELLPDGRTRAQVAAESLSRQIEIIEQSPNLSEDMRPWLATLQSIADLTAAGNFGSVQATIASLRDPEAQASIRDAMRASGMNEDDVSNSLLALEMALMAIEQAII